MANNSILAAFERFWVHVVSRLSEKADVGHSHNDYATKTGDLAGCWISYTDEDGNPTDEPYIHYAVDEDGNPVYTGLSYVEEGEF